MSDLRLTGPKTRTMTVKNPFFEVEGTVVKGVDFSPLVLLSRFSTQYS